MRSDISPDEVVARGAGMVAREFRPSDVYLGPDVAVDDGSALVSEAAEGALVLQDVTSHTLGIMAYRGDRAEMVPILPKDSRIPGEKTEDGFTNGSGATEIDVLIFQGESPVPFDNDLIGKLPIVLPESKEQGHYRFEVTFSLDIHGLLKVAVKSLNDGQLWQTDVQCNVRATREQIEASAAHLSEVMATPGGGGAAAPAGTLPPPPGTLPKPPGSLPRPPGRTATAAAPLPPPPDGTPDEFKSAARRSFKLGAMSALGTATG